jgi:hypothetical protein
MSCRANLPLTGLIAVSLAGCQHALHANVEVAAGGGFAGVREAEVQTEPNMICSNASPPACTEDANNNVFVANNKYSWRPSLSTGVIFRWTEGKDTSGGKYGTGIGGHFVFVPAGKDTRPAPAITLHFGTRSTQLFAGSLLIPVDKADLPNGAARFIGPRSLDPKSFVREGADRAWNFFAGIIVAGAAVTKLP